MKILFFIKVKILMLIKWSYMYPPPLPAPNLLNMSFLVPFLDPHLTTYHSNIGIQVIDMLELSSLHDQIDPWTQLVPTTSSLERQTLLDFAPKLIMWYALRSSNELWTKRCGMCCPPNLQVCCALYLVMCYAPNSTMCYASRIVDSNMHQIFKCVVRQIQ